MPAYQTQQQLVRRDRRRKFGLAAVLGTTLLGVSAAVVTRTPGFAAATGSDPAQSGDRVFASTGDENFRRQLEKGGGGGNAIDAIKSLFSGKTPAEPQVIDLSKTQIVAADGTYAAAVAANSLQPSGNDTPEATPSKEETAGTLIADGTTESGKLELGVNRTAVLTTRNPYKRLSVGSPEIADVTPVGPTSVLVTAKKAGSTQLTLWDESDRSEVVDIVVSLDLEALRTQIKKAFPGANVEVEAVNGAVTLRGRVPSIQVADQIVATASPFSDKVMNFLEVAGGQQVMLQVKFLEMSRRASEELGINLGATFNDGSTNASFNGPNAGSKGTNPLLSTLTGSQTFERVVLDYALSALKQNNLARVLAEPSVTVISGQEASLLAGGEFPVPVPQSGSGGGSTITIEYREFGVRLNVTPVVLGDGRIRLKVAPEVSDLDFSSPIVIDNNNIPIINKRRVQSTVEMGDGQTFAIGGLMRNTVTASRSGTPLLSDLPIIGTLFRSIRYQREETELVVLVTPSLVEPMNPAEVPNLPGEYWRHPNPVDFYFNGKLGEPAPAKDALPARFRGDYGFAPAATQTSSVER